MKREIDADRFFDVFASAVVYWERLLGRAATFDLPDAELNREVRAMLGTAFVTFSAGRPHYGHKFYGQETHDNFPPTVLVYVETTFLLGMVDKATEALSHFLTYGFDPFGRLIYRQGEEDVLGASASEYGQILWLSERLGDAFPARHLATLKLIGHALASKISETEEFPGLKLISMCAEADTNSRVHVYVQNCLWASRGSSALAAMLSRASDPEAEFFGGLAKELLSDTLVLIEKLAVQTPAGKLPPFRADYPVLPYNLSGCSDTTVPLDEKERIAYSGSLSWCRTDAEEGQDFTENCYANYRYYPEMLSSGLMPEEYEKACMWLRDNYGGECLGMTRLFGSGLDDWPVYNMARYLLRTGQKERYLLLMYAHLLHHGEAETGVWYEQRSIDGTNVAPDCVPSVLTVPLMLGWAFVYESTDGGEIRLLEGVPDSWFKKNFSVKGLCCRYGRIDIEYDAGAERLDISLPAGAKAKLSPRLKSGITAVITRR